jgi:hypothetical protein
MIGILLGMLGCGDNEVADVAAPDAGVPTADASTDACVEARGNCGCVIEETVHYGATGPVVTTQVVCP